MAATRVISSDAHLEVLPERWTHRVESRYRDMAPRRVMLPDGGDGLVIGDGPVQEANATDLRAGRPEGRWKPFGMRYEDAGGTGPPEQRLKEQETDGLDGEVLYPGQVGGPSFWRSIEDAAAYNAVVRGYNDWLAEEYCSVAPDRLIGLGVLPWTNTDDMIAEMERCARLGFKGVLLGVFPNGRGYPTADDDRFWAAALDIDIPITVHVQLSRSGSLAKDPTFVYPVTPPPEVASRIRRGPIDRMSRFGLEPALSLSQLVLAGVFDRFPKLKLFFAETRVGWLPFWFEQCDLQYFRTFEWAKDMLGAPRLDRLPSEYLKEHIYWSIQYEKAAVDLRYHIGVDHLLFATDFPHIECEYPNTQQLLGELYADVSEEERERIWAGNVIDYFRLS